LVARREWSGIAFKLASAIQGHQVAFTTTEEGRGRNSAIEGICQAAGSLSLER